MPDDIYPDMDEMPEAAKAGSEPEPEKSDTEEASGSTTLIPKSLLAGKDFKVGDEVVLKITHEYDEDFAVEYAPEKPKEKGGLPGPEEFEAADKGESYG